ncbi:MAG: sulfurtransferase, partial [Gemmatimonadetes bacterium]|nr:sulfurtransferase [Gemmatimonadota bacterium]
MTHAPALRPVTDVRERGYAHPEVLVSTAWVADHLGDPAVRILESDEDLLLYETGHLPGAVKIDWVGDLNDPVIRDYIGREPFQKLLRRLGITTGQTIVFYGDKNNWWATYAFWVFRLFGVENLRVMDGGRLRWAEERRPMTTEVPRHAEGTIAVGPRNDARIRAFRPDVEEHIRLRRPLVDVRSPEEYRGERLHMP